MDPKILVITPVRHIVGVSKTLESIGHVTYMDDPSLVEVIDVIEESDCPVKAPTNPVAVTFPVDGL